jgi:hypothetical protein
MIKWGWLVINPISTSNDAFGTFQRLGVAAYPVFIKIRSIVLFNSGTRPWR